MERIQELFERVRAMPIFQQPAIAVAGVCLISRVPPAVLPVAVAAFYIWSSRTPRFTCQKCSRSKPVEGSFAAGECGCHICKGCMHQHVVSNVESQEQALLCPANGCRQQLTEATIAQVLIESQAQLTGEFLSLHYINCAKCTASTRKRLSLAAGCSHRFCQSCPQTHLQSMMESNRVGRHQLTCPLPCCTHSLTDDEIKAFGGDDRLELISALREADEAVRNFTCPVCYDEKPKEGSFTAGCNHWVCTDCIVGYVTSKINSNEVSEDEIPCPQCPQQLTEHDVLGVLQQSEHKDELRQKYLDRVLEKKMDADPDYHKCPGENCNYRFVWKPSWQPAFECPACEAAFCLACAGVGDDMPVGPGHPGRTCAEQKVKLAQDAEERKKYEAWKRDNDRADELFNELMRRNAEMKACPKCNFGIERSGGCNHVQCTKCSCKFCFRCLKYRANNQYTCGSYSCR